MQRKIKPLKLTLQRQSAKFIDCWFWHFKTTCDDVLLQLQEELIARQLLAQCVWLGWVKLNFQVQRVRRTDLDLLLDRLRWIQPVLDIVGISELQAEIILFDEVERVEHLLVQIIRERFFLQMKRNKQQVRTWTCWKRLKTNQFHCMQQSDSRHEDVCLIIHEIDVIYNLHWKCYIEKDY